MSNQLTKYFPNCRRILGKKAWGRVLSALGDSEPMTFIRHLNLMSGKKEIHAYLADTALLEFNLHEVARKPVDVPDSVDIFIVNPDLMLIPVQWKNLPSLLDGVPTGETPEKGEGHVLIWREPETGRIQCRDAVDDDLLALKLVVDAIDIREVAQNESTTLGKVMAVLYRSVGQGLLIAPESGITRDPVLLPEEERFSAFIKSEVFTLQWHITQACDLHCRHCYDRSDRAVLSLPEADAVLDDFFDFTRAMNVRGHVTFTGGNPLLYPGFTKLYQSAANRGFSTAILGNPTSEKTLDNLLAIQPMTHYQISLEGLEPYNDYIRGDGHFKRSLAFLETLRGKGIYAMVMLTLNRDNIDQVLGLAQVLRSRADSFTFNRLAMVGEGENLRLPVPEDFNVFLQDYLDTMPSNPILSLKDNLFNILRERDSSDLSGGCTGYGCGAAFNFVSLLPDGEVHACRKFPSMIGQIKTDSLLTIYNSSEARRYRAGSEACKGCSLSAVCRGCPAVVYGAGLDPFKFRDPFCFYAAAPDF